MGAAGRHRADGRRSVHRVCAICGVRSVSHSSRRSSRRRRVRGACTDTVRVYIWGLGAGTRGMSAEGEALSGMYAPVRNFNVCIRHIHATPADQLGQCAHARGPRASTGPACKGPPTTTSARNQLPPTSTCSSGLRDYFSELNIIGATSHALFGRAEPVATPPPSPARHARGARPKRVLPVWWPVR